MVGLALLVGFLNVGFFKFGTIKSFTDHSHAFELLSYHPQMNNQYYSKETSITTVMVAKDGLVAQAQADDFEGLTDTQAIAPQDDNGDPSMLTGDSLVQLNPDSIKALIAKQIKIYQTEPGDTLQSIAAANGISMQTILNANNLLAGTVIKPGWQLIILPIDGVLYTANSNDTLPDVAKKFSGNLDTIISYNGLDSAEDITAGDLIIIPGGTLPAPQVPKTPVKPKIDKSKIGGSGPVENIAPEPNVVDDGSGHIFPKGYCTWYVAQKIHIPWGGNAKSWISNAESYGAVVDMDPAHGTILVTNESRKYGHVAYVESVTDHNTVIVSEMNYDHFGRVDTREISLNSPVIRGFIHP